MKACMFNFLMLLVGFSLGAYVRWIHLSGSKIHETHSSSQPELESFEAVRNTLRSQTRLHDVDPHSHSAMETRFDTASSTLAAGHQLTTQNKNDQGAASQQSEESVNANELNPIKAQPPAVSSGVGGDAVASRLGGSPPPSSWRAQEIKARFQRVQAQEWRRPRLHAHEVPGGSHRETQATTAWGDNTTTTTSTSSVRSMKNTGGEGPLFAAFATASMQEFLLNWIHGLRHIGVEDKDIVVAPFDDEIEALCKKEGIPLFSSPLPHMQGDGAKMATGGLPLSGSGIAAPTDGRPFQRIGQLKVTFISALLNQQGRPVLLTDVDTGWIKDPREFFPPPNDGAGSGVDLWVSTDCLTPRAEGHKVLAGPLASCAPSQLNTGIMFLHPTRPVQDFLKTWLDALHHPVDQYENDQGVFNRVLHKWRSQWRMAPPRGVQVHAGLRLGLLPILLFTSGHVYFVQHLPKRKGVLPYLVHTTYQFSHSMGKRQRLREAGLWHLDSQDYYTQGDFITFRPTLPQHLGLPMSAPPIQRHMHAVAFYRLSMRNTLALARALNRTLIVPPLLCFCDRWWGNILPGCIIPQSDQELPFQCPHDHLFYLPNWEAGQIQYREHSFLSHPLIPSAINSSQATVRIASQMKSTSAASQEWANATLPAGATDQEARQALQAVSHVRVLTLLSAHDAFCRFENQEENIKFDRLMDSVLKAEVWFCANTIGKHSGRECTIGYPLPYGLATKQGDCTGTKNSEWTAQFDPQQMEGYIRNV